MNTISQILENSARLNELQKAIHDTFKERGKSPNNRALWSDACDKFHESFDKLYFLGGSETIARIKANDPKAIDIAIDFLIADPVHFRSGYLKEDFWRRLPRWQLSDTNNTKVENAALSYLNKTIRRDFWYMCRAMARIGTVPFWQQVEQRLSNSNSLQAKRASYLLAYKAGIDAGERLRKQVYYEVLHMKYGESRFLVQK